MTADRTEPINSAEKKQAFQCFGVARSMTSAAGSDGQGDRRGGGGLLVVVRGGGVGGPGGPDRPVSGLEDAIAAIAATT